MPPVKRNQYSAATKQFWVELFRNSDHSTLNKFHAAVHEQHQSKEGRLWDQSRNIGPIPPIKTFKKWLEKANFTKIQENAFADYKKMRPPKYPELDEKIKKYINESGSLLSEHGISAGITWANVRQRALQFKEELHNQGLMSDEDYHSFTASNGWIDKLKRRLGPSVSSLVGQANTVSEEELADALDKIADNELHTLETKNADSALEQDDEKKKSNAGQEKDEYDEDLERFKQLNNFEKWRYIEQTVGRAHKVSKMIIEIDDYPEPVRKYHARGLRLGETWLKTIKAVKTELRKAKDGAENKRVKCTITPFFDETPQEKPRNVAEI